MEKRIELEKRGRPANQVSIHINFFLFFNFQENKKHQKLLIC